MNYRDEILKTIRFEKTEKTPAAVLNGQMWICARHGLTAAELLDLPDAGASILFEDYQKMGSYILTAGCTASWVMMSAMGGEVDMNRIAAEITKSPMRKIEEIEKFSIEETIARMRGDHYYKRCLVQVKKMRELAGDQYLIGGGFFGPFTIAAQMVGLGKFMLQLRKGVAARKILDFASEICYANYLDLIEAGVDLITLPEPMASGDMISLKMMEELVAPVDRALMDRIRSKCPVTLVHICGDTANRVPLMAENGYSIFSVDSIDLVKAQEDCAKRMALFGNLNPAQILVEKTADEVYEYSKALCAQMKPYGGFILAPGCDLAPNIPLENLQAMTRAAAEV